MQSLGGSTKRLGLPKVLASLPEFIGEGGFGSGGTPQPPVGYLPAAIKQADASYSNFLVKQADGSYARLIIKVA